MSSRWYQTFPLGTEGEGPFRASMVLRYPAGTEDLSRPGLITRDRFAPDDGLPLVLPRQVHGNEILQAGCEDRLPLRPACDGILLVSGGVRAALRYADCFPVLLWGLDPKPWMLGLHSGFRGTLLNICRAGALRVEETLGRGALSTCRAWVGPGICGDCYVRRPEDPFVARVKSLFPRECWTEGPDGIHPHLSKVIVWQLAEAGVPRGSISRSGLCTACDHSVCYSYRCGDVLPRMWLFFEVKDFPPFGQKTGL